MGNDAVVDKTAETQEGDYIDSSLLYLNKSCWLQGRVYVGGHYRSGGRRHYGNRDIYDAATDICKKGSRSKEKPNTERVEGRLYE